MIKAVLILGLAAIASAQVLRISPVVIGSTSAGQQQIIQLARGGGISPYRVQQARPVQIAVAPQVVRQIAVAPQIVRQIAVRPISVRPISVVSQPQIVLSQPSPISYGRVVENEQPAPYAFAFDSEDEYGTKQGRQESADGSGTITGQYTLSDASGIARIVTYVADANGFRADVKTNEPGTLTSNPADVTIQSSAAPGRK